MTQVPSERAYPTRLQMPFLLLAGMGFSAFFAVCVLVTIPIMVASTLFGRTFEVNGQAATKAEFLAVSWPVFVIFPALAAAVLTIAYGLWKERGWTREAILAFWLVGGAALVIVQLSAPAASSDFLGGLASWAFCAGIAAWYLYGTDGVRKYYRAIAARHGTPAGDGA